MRKLRRYRQFLVVAVCTGVVQSYELKWLWLKSIFFAVKDEDTCVVRVDADYTITISIDGLWRFALQLISHIANVVQRFLVI